jgi:flagellar hook-associated protein 3 FlgL
MRVSNNFIYNQSLTDLTKSNERYLQTQRRISENTDIMTASDDPVGAAQVMRYEAVNLLLDQYSENAVMAKK